MNFVHGAAGLLVVAVTECAAEAAARGVIAVFGGLLVGAVNISEHLAPLLLFRIIVARLVIEHSVFLVPKEPEIESCHRLQR